MPIWNNFPYSNTHELNLDWIIKAVKEWGEKVDDYSIKVDDLDAAFNSLKDFVDNYFDNLDVQEEINNKLDEMAENGDLIALLAPYLPFVTPEMFGAVGDGVADDTAALRSMFNSGAHTIVFTESKTYNTAGITAPNMKDVAIYGNGATLNNIRTDLEDVLTYTNSFMLTNDEHTRAAVENNGNIEIQGLIFRQHGSDFINYDNTYPDANQCISLTMYQNVFIHDCQFYDTFMGAIQTWGCRNVKVERCYFNEIGNVLANPSNSHVRNCLSAFATCYGNLSGLHVDCDIVEFTSNIINRADFGCSQRSFKHAVIKNNTAENVGYLDEDFPGWDGLNYYNTEVIVKENVCNDLGCLYTYSVSTPTSPHRVFIEENSVTNQKGHPIAICYRADAAALISFVFRNNFIECDLSSYTGTLTAMLVLTARNAEITNNRLITKRLQRIIDNSASPSIECKMIINDNYMEGDNILRAVNSLYSDIEMNNNKIVTELTENTITLHSQGTGYKIQFNYNEANTVYGVQMQNISGTYASKLIEALGNILMNATSLYRSLSSTSGSIIVTKFNNVPLGSLNLPAGTVRATEDNITA